jgi:hypothetical protein
MDNPFGPGDEKVEEVVELTEEVESKHSKQLKVVAEVTAKLEAASNGRVEAEIGLEEEYWKVRDELNRANRRLEELR